MASSTPGMGWPAAKVPIELFILIAVHLDDRSDVQNMRLVSREFNAKLAADFFRNLVVHFGRDLYTTLDIAPSPSVRSSSVDITNRLMETTTIFDVFGTTIRRFGLALELTDEDLAASNDDDPLVLHKRPWGMYRWPRTASPSLLQKIAVSLEDSTGVCRILRRLSRVQELALSCDGGLGYLRGPDTNRLALSQKPAVFGDPNLNPGHQSAPPRLDSDGPSQYERLQQSMLAHGIAPDSVLAEIQKLLKNEGKTLEDLASEGRQRCPLPRDRPGRRGLVRECDCCKARSKTLRLQPDMLTAAQRQMLLHHLSAHQALIQSYLLGVIDNATTFVNLTNIKIASLPSFHVELLCRDEFWSKLPNLEKVSLAIIPDWRKVAELGPDSVKESQVYPTDAMPKVFNLLQNYIGKQQGIKHLHFEWLCGGELAPGRLQRNRHILPAPFLKEHLRVSDSRPENLLILPFVTHLSLKNCWFAPHVFFRIIRTMAANSLQSLELETVSLTGPPHPKGVRGGRAPRDRHNGGQAGAAQAGAAQAGAAQANAFQVLVAQAIAGQVNAGNNLPPALLTLRNAIAQRGLILPTNILRSISTYLGEPVDDDSEPVEEPPTLSWAHIIDMLTPGETIRETLHQQEMIADPLIEPLHLKKQLHLRRLAFKSCGYVTIPDNRFISDRPLEAGALDGINGWEVHRKEAQPHCLKWFMQVNTDRLLGRTSSFLGKKEQLAMRRVFRFRTGWKDVYDDRVIKAAKEDGIVAPGKGRFSGEIEYHPTPTPLERYAGTLYAADEEDGVEYVEDYNTLSLHNDYDDEFELARLQKELEEEAHYQPAPPRQRAGRLRGGNNGGANDGGAGDGGANGGGFVLVVDGFYEDALD
ncbi:Uu.00g091270.m01.CDS01 [Anthostomella pinea]|uniref:Uu.00g091270.m01.CDS01 n=1 Tax=Anthostomella pinea TaxID=933095 RepID=A0AAI8VN07_9PEZI|nr:Uu.00g091270.m01.CDS01 [Anthostomella pinea]